ncbi:hypothetical protein RclHR1_04490005 [Rhizophagus clarus]|uniref:Protein kinase domain-containing protein n=1 Tax=Rhizophagus clarus TaxID=94130 RepID=A0A2Z6SBZ1_9GLOM|nr:hypothetical protein RclHR1_04490005 [Rhizophagus clarus]
MDYFTKTFANWTSGNEIIDKFIQKKQLEYEYYEIKCRGKKICKLLEHIDAIFEWIPYDKFIEIKGTRISNFATAVWKEGPLSYNGNDEEWIRSSYEEVMLKYLYDSKIITDEFINEVNSYLLFKGNYGISQNPDTKDYILVFSKENFERYNCKKCGDKYEYDYKDYKDSGQRYNDRENKWCKSCHINRLKNNFTNWASGNEKIDKFIQQRQLNIKTSYDLIFEWIPFNEFIDIKEIRKGGFSVAIWKEGRLRYDIIKKEWMKEPYRKVVLKYLNSQNITDEFFKEVTILYDSYGISQNPITKEYILVVHHKYNKKYCEVCNKEYIKLNHNWCESCQINYLKSNFINWTSGNGKIDGFIQKMQLKISNESSNVFEWIPYSELSEIKEIGDNCLTTAIWNKGSLNYNTHEKKWMRTSYKKVCLKYLYYSQNITDEFIIKIESYLTNEIYYGVSQNQDTKVYVLVFNNDYLDKRCEKCGNEYEKHDQKWCKCHMEYLKNNLTDWTSGNEKLDGLIQKYQLKYDGNGKVFEWIPYHKFVDVKEIRRGDFAIALWTDGSLYYSIPNRKFKRKSNKKVLLKYSNISRNNDDFLNKISYLMENSYGISRDPNTKDYILVYNIGYYCENCGKMYDKFKSCVSCQTNCENEKINDLVQEMKLNIDYNSSYSYKIFEWIPYDQFFDIKEIGKGGFSTVYSAIWKDGLLDCRKSLVARNWRRNPNTRVALKCLHNSQNCIDEFINEVKAYSDQKIYNVLKIYGISQNPDTKDYIMVLEYAIGGSFNSYLVKNYENFNWFNGLKVLRDIINGLYEIHQKQMVHRDFHIGNILFMSDNYNACISDMGLCKKIDDIDEKNIYGVIPYVAPEVLNRKPYTQAADIYSFGMIMYVVATGRQPFDDRAHDEVLVLNICNGIRPEINKQIIPTYYIDLMKKCWDSNPENRPFTIDVKEKIELFYNSLDKEFKKEEHHYKIEEQFKETQESRKDYLLSIKNNKPTTHTHAVYTSRLLNPFTKNLFNSTVEITDFTK